jgi:hypothetical protein
MQSGMLQEPQWQLHTWICILPWPPSAMAWQFSQLTFRAMRAL